MSERECRDDRVRAAEGLERNDKDENQKNLCPFNGYLHLFHPQKDQD